MQLIAHRRNTTLELDQTPTQYGVEVDLRTHGTRLIVHHDPFVDGVDFDEWIARYRHRTLILNVKEEGIERRVQEIVEARGIRDYFFLDLSFPFLIRLTQAGENRVAVRYSEFESIETVLALAGKALWVWIDCFTRLPIDRRAARLLKDAGFRICLVSPELQGRSVEQIAEYRACLRAEEIVCDAVCTKRPDLWEARLV